MKKVFLPVLLFASFLLNAQLSADTLKLIEQQDHIIRPETVIKIENIGRNKSLIERRTSATKSSNNVNC